MQGDWHLRGFNLALEEDSHRILVDSVSLCSFIPLHLVEADVVLAIAGF